MNTNWRRSHPAVNETSASTTWTTFQEHFPEAYWKLWQVLWQVPLVLKSKTLGKYPPLPSLRKLPIGALPTLDSPTDHYKLCCRKFPLHLSPHLHGNRSWKNAMENYASKIIPSPQKIAAIHIFFPILNPSGEFFETKIKPFSKKSEAA